MTWRAGVVQKSNQGRCHEFEGGGVNALEVKEVNTVKKLKFEKGGVCMTPPPAPIVALPLGYSNPPIACA